jgi:hypothetical protein
MRFLAAWALVHETADEGWKAAVERGREAGVEGMQGGPGAFVDGLSAMVAEEKERLKARLAEGPQAAEAADKGEDAEKLRFELAEIRGRLEAIETSLDALRRHVEQS